jgi:hypothetical protein
MPQKSMAQVTYTYTGQPLTTCFELNVEVACTSISRVSGSFTVPAPLGANAAVSITPEAFTFTDGFLIFTANNTASNPNFQIFTDSSGAISQ